MPERPKARTARPVKHSFTIAGHRTSISLEAAFWTALKTAAAAERTSLAALVAHIDATRGEAGLSSAVRVWVLGYVRRHAAEQGEASGSD
jgi:predicted DNA-binding ribbon-helix-helix protein